MSSKDGALRVGVVGCGAFGRIMPAFIATFTRTLPRTSSLSASPTAIPPRRDHCRRVRHASFRTPEELIAAGVEAASVAVPTVSHLEVARKLLENGVDVLIEKPLAASVAEADELIALARKHQRVAQAGHLERFNPAVRATAPLLTQPMFFEVHRLSVFTPRSLDVDVILDLMIHDLDVVLSFVKSPVKEIRAVGLPILSKKVDIANVRMEFDSGCVANFTASRVSTERIRKLRFFQPHQYISLDYSRQDVLVLTVEEANDAGAEADPFNPASMTAGAFAGITPFKPKVEQQEPLRAELSSFLRAVRERSTPEVTLEDGRRALAVATQIVEAIAEHTRRANLLQLTQAES